jgi:RNA polymerase sigma-70 factor (ECF subfamily)
MGENKTRDIDAEAAVDARLVAGVRTGDAAAAASLYGRYCGTVRFVVADKVRNRDDIDDVVQEVFARAFGRLDQLTEATRFRAWLLQIARRAAIDARRARVRQPATLSLGDRDVIDLTESVDLVAEVGDLADGLRAGLAGLSTRDRAVLTMTIELGFSLDDVASALDITHGNAKVVLHRARRRLRATVEPLLVAG